MVSETQDELQKNLARYLKGDITLHEFEDWFAPVLWNLAESGDDPAREIAGSVHILISEFSDGTLQLETFRERLGTLVPNVV
jgi:hypothetical protein